ncbi:hypothetical protein TIFTF001_023803 [Ficus carica]|uniref:Uncharacterized protein n=1 Tax=Ficus carica TaxID=3494 RepID=A0AA88AXA6_FICCA|nr:hypothetical protein TIFTF001_023803 [Ficus carica]
MGMGKCGCIGPLIKMLDDKATGEKEPVTKALSSSSLTVMLSAMNIKIFRRDRKGIVPSVQVLGVEDVFPVGKMAL